MLGKSNVLINHVLLERVLRIKESNALHDDSFKIWENELSNVEKIKLTRLAEMAESLSKEEIAVLVIIAAENYPEMVFQIMMEELLVNKERNGKKDER